METIPSNVISLTSSLFSFSLCCVVNMFYYLVLVYALLRRYYVGLKAILFLSYPNFVHLDFLHAFLGSNFFWLHSTS